MSLASVASPLLELDPTAPPAAAVALDEQLLTEVNAGRAAATLRIWECAEAIVLPRRQARALPPGPLGDGVCGRRSGGSAVALGPGVLCVSLIVPLAHGAPAVDPTYALWLDGVGTALRAAYGVETAPGKVPGAFCDGAHNATAGGRKLAGTAQARRPHAALVHGCLLLDVDPAEYCARLAPYAEGDPDPSLVTTLREQAGREIDRGELATALAAGFASDSG